MLEYILLPLANIQYIKPDDDVGVSETGKGYLRLLLPRYAISWRQCCTQGTGYRNQGRYLPSVNILVLNTLTNLLTIP